MQEETRSLFEMAILEAKSKWMLEVGDGQKGYTYPLPAPRKSIVGHFRGVAFLRDRLQPMRLQRFGRHQREVLVCCIPVIKSRRRVNEKS